MKNVLIIALLAVTAGFYGCNKTSSITKSNQQAIVGRWMPVSEHDKVYNSTNGVLVLDTTYTIGTADSTDYYETFTSNSTSQITEVKTGAVTANFTFKITADELTFYQNGDTNLPSYYTILSLTSTNLLLETQFAAYPAAGSILNTSEIYDYTSDVYFDKQ
jgi:hypothetical protein